MNPELDVTRRLGPLDSTSGAGTVFEYRVAAIMYSYLLAGHHPPGLLTPAAAVGLQQKVRGHDLDDIVLYHESGSGPASLDYQVKKATTATAGNKAFREVVETALDVLSARCDDVAHGTLRLGLIAGGKPVPLKELGELTEMADAHPDPETFWDVDEPVAFNRDLQRRREHVRKAVEKAAAAGAHDLGGARTATHRLLRALKVHAISAGESGDHYRDALNRLQPLADELGVQPVTLFSELAGLASQWGKFAGVTDAENIKRELRFRGLGAGIGTASGLSAVHAARVDADAAIRGALEATGLIENLRQVEQAETGIDTAAHWSLIIQRLEAGGFAPHARWIRRRHAEAIEGAGSLEVAALQRCGLAWEHIDASEPFEAGFALGSDWRKRTEGVDPHVERALQATSHAVSVAKGNEPQPLIDHFDQMQVDDPYVARAAAYMCEGAIAHSLPHVITSRCERLMVIAEQAGTSGEGTTLLCEARIRMCIADASGDWQDLLNEIRFRHSPETRAWIHARYGRFLALTGEGRGALAQYRHALGGACTNGMYGDAVTWLYALRTVRFWYGDATDDEQHPVAQAFRPRTTPSRLPGSSYAAEQALRALHDKRAPRTALPAVDAWLW